MPYRMMAASVLADWRAVQRDLATTPAGSPEAKRLQAELITLHQEYQRLIDDALMAHRAPPPAFPKRRS